MGELYDFGKARREQDARRGIKPGVIDRLADALGMRSDRPTKGTATDLEGIAASSEIEPDVRQAAREISDLLHGRVEEIVEEQRNKEE
jgi:hypothetical protein